jgi:hypothetical protein
MYFLEWACAVQVSTLAMGRPLHAADPAAITKVASYRTAGGSSLSRDLVWPAMLRKVERQSPGYDL